MAMQTTREKPRDRSDRPRLRLVRGAKNPASTARVVAEVLSDGTVRPLAGTKSWDTHIPNGGNAGEVSGNGWTLWWEHRPWTGRTA